MRLPSGCTTACRCPLLIEAVRVFAWAVETRQTILISGGTRTGKSSLLNALAAFLPQDERIVLIEDTAGLSIQVDGPWFAWKPGENNLASRAVTIRGAAAPDFTASLKPANSHVRPHFQVLPQRRVCLDSKQPRYHAGIAIYSVRIFIPVRIGTKKAHGWNRELDCFE